MPLVKARGRVSIHYFTLLDDLDLCCVTAYITGHIAG